MYEDDGWKCGRSFRDDDLSLSSPRRNIIYSAWMEFAIGQSIISPFCCIDRRRLVQGSGKDQYVTITTNDGNFNVGLTIHLLLKTFLQFRIARPIFLNGSMGYFHSPFHLYFSWNFNCCSLKSYSEPTVN